MTNPYGCWTLFVREVRRFLNVKVQTIIAPALTALLYLVVFHYAMGARPRAQLPVDYFTFLAPGLAMMTLLQNAFANSSSSMITGKVMGVHVYLLMAPLSAAEVVLAFVAAAVVRGLVCAGAFLLALVPFVHFAWPHPWLALSYAVLGGAIMGALGLIAGIWARRFDDVALVTNFVVMPLTFLAGVFYSVQSLPPLWRSLHLANPFFHLVDGFRFAVLGVADADPWWGLAPLAAAALLLFVLAWRLWAAGWKLKA